MSSPDHLKYSKEHEWVRMDGDDAVIGITAFAAEQLGDIVFVELPEEGATLTADQPFGVVESVKSVSDLFAPISGTIVAVNNALTDAPEMVNDDPFDGAWMVRIKPDNPADVDGLMSATDYDAMTAE